MRAFFDTNILVYAQQAEPRGERARALLADGGVIRVQVLNEFTNVLRKKFARDWISIAEAVDDVRDVCEEPSPLTVKTHHAALDLARLHGLAFYDALIVASALESECDVLLTEDMQHGRAFGRMTICNPFL